MHGTFKSGRPERPRPTGGGEFRLILRILLREVAVGCPLYLLLGRNPVLNILICTIAFAALLALTNRHGLLRHRTKLDIVTECLAVLMGGLAFRTILGLAPALLGLH